MDHSVLPIAYETLLAETKRHLNRDEFSAIFKDALDGYDANAQQACRADIQAFLVRYPGLRFDEVLIQELYNDILLYGPITPYVFASPSEAISEIQIYTENRIYLHQHGKWRRLLDVAFRSKQELDNVIKKMLTSSDVPLSDRDGYTDRVNLPNGSRGTILRAPNTSTDYFVTIRTFNDELFSTDKLVDSGSVSLMQDKLLKFLMRGRANGLWTGGTNTGKTTHLGAYLPHLPVDWHVVTIEDNRELHLQERNPHMHVTSLLIQDGKSSFTWEKAYSLVLRIAPDVIIYGELREPQPTFHCVNSMGTGHPGSATTIHAGSAHDAIENATSFYHEVTPQVDKSLIMAKVCRAVDFISLITTSRKGVRYMSDVVAVGWDDKTCEPIFHPMISRYYDQYDQPVERFHDIPSFLKKKLLNWHYVFEEDFKEWDS